MQSSQGLNDSSSDGVSPLFRNNHSLNTIDSPGLRPSKYCRSNRKKTFRNTNTIYFF